MSENDQNTPEKGSQYRYDDGTVEVVFTTEDGRVLTVREYPSVGTFETATESASDAGIHESIAALPDVESFAEEIESSDEEGGSASPDEDP